MTLLSDRTQSAKNMEHFLSLVSPYGSEMLTLESFRFEDKDDYEYEIFSILAHVSQCHFGRKT